MTRWLAGGWLVCAVVAHAQLAVSVSAPKVTGSKALVKLELRNTFAEKIESARAVCFLTDEQGKVVGQSTQWVIGGTRERPALAPGATNRFHFVMAAERLTTTNLAANLSFSRLVLAGGQRADPVKDISIVSAGAAR